MRFYTTAGGAILAMRSRCWAMASVVRSATQAWPKNPYRAQITVRLQDLLHPLALALPDRVARVPALVARHVRCCIARGSRK